MASEEPPASSAEAKPAAVDSKLLFNHEAMLAQLGDKNTVRKICDSFLKRSADTKERLIKAMEEKAMQDLRRHAHSLKGACGYICSEQLRGSALKLQLACDEINEGRSTDMANVEEGSRRVHDELDQVIAAINQYLEAGDAK